MGEQTFSCDSFCSARSGSSRGRRRRRRRRLEKVLLEDTVADDARDEYNGENGQVDKGDHGQTLARQYRVPYVGADPQ